MVGTRISNEAGALAEAIQRLATYRGWKSDTIRKHFAECESVQQLAQKCSAEDVDVRITAAWLLGNCQVDAWELDAVIDALRPLLTDDRTNEVVYGGLSADCDEEPTCVADVAAEALDRLRPNWRPRTPK